jgi:hypothetical protein
MANPLTKTGLNAMTFTPVKLFSEDALDFPSLATHGTDEINSMLLSPDNLEELLKRGQNDRPEAYPTVRASRQVVAVEASAVGGVSESLNQRVPTI